MINPFTREVLVDNTVSSQRKQFASRMVDKMGGSTLPTDSASKKSVMRKYKKEIKVSGRDLNKEYQEKSHKTAMKLSKPLGKGYQYMGY